MKNIKYLLALVMTASIVACSSDNEQDKPTPPEKPSYKVGDLYDRNGITGVVYYLNNEEGTSGYVVSLKEWEAAWSEEFIETGAMRLSLGEGMINNNIIKRLDNWKLRFPAFSRCNTLNSGLVTTWILPSSAELQWIGLSLCTDGEIDQAKLEAFNKTLTDAGGDPISLTNYWSSSEFSASQAYPINLAKPNADSDYYETGKEKKHKVRAVTVF